MVTSAHALPPDLPSEVADWLGIQSAGAQGGSGRDWWAFPHRKRPRLMIPRASGSWTSALGMMSHSRRVNWLRRILPWLSRIGWPPAWRGAGVGDCPLDGWLGRLLDRPPVHFAVYLGTPSIYAKQTIQCQDVAGRVMAYVKVPQGRRASDAILHEWETLAMLASRFPGETWFPAPLGYEGGAAAQGPPPEGASATVATVAQAARIYDLMGRLEARPIAWADSPVRQELAAILSAGDQSGEREIVVLLREALVLLDARFAGTRPLHRFSHGDFLPWNTRGFGDSAFVFDWEWAGWRLPFHDAYHYLLVPLLGSGRLAREPLLTHLPKCGPFLAAQSQAAHGAGDDPLWCLAFLAERLAFYSRSCLEAGDLPSGHRTVTDLMQLLRIALATAGQSVQPSQP